MRREVPIYLAIATFLAGNGLAFAQGIPAKDVLFAINSNSETIRSYFIGLAHGIFWLNDEERKGEFDYCPPKNLAITVEQYISIFQKFIEKNPKSNTKPSGLVLVYALRDAFPCDR